LLVSIKKERIYFYFLCAGLTLNAMFNMVLIPTLQEKGAAISNVSTETFVAVSTFLFLAKTGFVRIQFKYFLSCLLPSLILIPLVILIRLSGLGDLFTLVTTALITMIFYAGIHWRFLRSVFIRKSVV
jgi:O-antigen/teichoic acid export membrane protein